MTTEETVVGQGDFDYAYHKYRSVPGRALADCEKICVFALRSHGISMNRMTAYELWQWWSGQADAQWLNVSETGELSVGNAVRAFCENFAKL